MSIENIEEEQREWAKVGLKYYYYMVDLEFDEYPSYSKPLFFTKVNGAEINQEKIGAFIELDNLIDNHYYNGCFCTLEEGDKLGDFFSCLPYGIINKTITGIGATTLEMNSDRNSIIVLPTKSLAYNKFNLKEAKDGENSCMYIGSPIGNITSDITPQKIQFYLNMNNGKRKKFLVVADSLPKVLKAIGEEHYNDYFLMIDEIDTLQIDNTYRPALENVIDYYAKFNQTNRAAVSATLREFTHPELQKDTVITTAYKTNPSRKIELRHTDNEDYCTIDTIKRILSESPADKIVVAYNSLDGILVCIKLLQKEIGENISDKIGILCGEMSKEKAGEYYIEIDNNCELPKQIVFMTCAYFVGIDINESCHIISVSTFNQPFTLLSVERMTQIVGRCRIGALSETIIYESKQLSSSESIISYKNKLIRKVDLFAKAINQFKETLNEAPELVNAVDYIENLIKYVSIEKVADDYPINLLREDSDNQIVPSYFNLDALCERWELHYSLYTHKETLPTVLKSKGHTVVENPLNHTYTEEQKQSLGFIKQSKDDKLHQDLEQAKRNLLEWDTITIPKLKTDKLQEYKKNSNKQLQKFYEKFEKLFPYFTTEYLADLLIEYHQEDERVYKKFINSLVLWALDDTHPFKALALSLSNYHSIIGAIGRKKGINISPILRREIMKNICDTYFRSYPIDSKTVNNLFLCLFKPAPTKKTFRIIGLNPMDFREPLSKITNNDPTYLLSLLELR
jgi:hypothetical protein